MVVVGVETDPAVLLWPRRARAAAMPGSDSSSISLEPHSSAGAALEPSPLVVMMWRLGIRGGAGGKLVGAEATPPPLVFGDRVSSGTETAAAAFVVKPGLTSLDASLHLDGRRRGSVFQRHELAASGRVASDLVGS